MTRRRIIFKPTGGIGFWTTPEINGDHDEFQRMGSADTCDLAWPEMKSLFCGVQSYDDFKQACDAMQRCFRSSITAAELEPPLHLLSLDGICCDELYEISNNVVRRVYETNLVYVQVYYREQESSIVDTVQFDCPPGVSQEEVLQAINSARIEMPIREDEDRISWMDDVLTRSSLTLHATWAYIPIAGVIDVA